MNEGLTGIIILAAGKSSRLGQPKQLLKYKGRSLLQIALDAANRSQTDSNLLVLGANNKQISAELHPEQTEIIINDHWSEGMSSSLKLGLDHMIKNINIHGVIILLCDQPFVSVSLINNLIAIQRKSQKGIVAAQYGNVHGVPALFTKRYFPSIRNLSGQEGARKLLYEFEHDLAIVDFPKGNIDIDTIEDYKNLIL